MDIDTVMEFDRKLRNYSSDPAKWQSLTVPEQSALIAEIYRLRAVIAQASQELDKAKVRP
jgi:hypothetical protein